MKGAVEELDRQSGAFENLPEGIRQKAIQRASNEHRRWFNWAFHLDVYHCRPRIHAVAFELARTHQRQKGGAN